VPGSLHHSIQDGSTHQVKEALKQGYFYLWKPSKQYNRRTFNIKKIEISDDKINIEIDNNSLVDTIQWLTYNPSSGKSMIIQVGNGISMKNIPDYCRFVRAEIGGVDGKIYTQPIYIKEK